MPKIWIRFCLALHIVGLVVTPGYAQPENEPETEEPTEIGVLSTTTPDGDDPRDVDPTLFGEEIDGVGDVETLLVLAQCFGGDVAKHPAIKSLPRTAIASGTSPGEVALYGGYHDDAAWELRPGDGRTGQLPHNAGISGKHEDETPLTEGTLALTDFSLESTSATGDVNGRVVVVYFGKPSTRNEWITVKPDGTSVPLPQAAPLETGTKTSFSDMTDLLKIKANFAGQHNTTFIAVGGAAGAANFEHPGTVEGLQAAMQTAKTTIEGGEGVWQLIVFVGDHGELRNARRANRRCAPQGARCALADDFDTLPGSPELRRRLIIDPDSAPGFSVFASFPGAPVPLQRSGPGYAPIFSQGALTLEVTPISSGPIKSTKLAETVVDISGDGTLGDVSGEGVQMFFYIDPAAFADRLLGVPVDLTLINNGIRSLDVTEVGQSTGPVERGYSDRSAAWPLWMVLAIGLTLILLVWLVIRWHRSP